MRVFRNCDGGITVTLDYEEAQGIADALAYALQDRSEGEAVASELANAIADNTEEGRL